MASKKAGSGITEATLANYDRIITGTPGVARKGASMPYTSLNGNMFSFLSADGSMALRLPAKSRENFIKKHKTTLCEAHGTVLKEYVAVPEKLFRDTEKIKEYFQQSFEYASTLKPKATTKTSKTAATKKPSKTLAKESKSSITGMHNEKVDEFLKKKGNPLTAEIRRVREIILAVSDKIEEDIKWSAPTFMYKGNIASFYMNSKNHVSLMFHYGASLPDKKGLLEGDGAVSRVAKFTDMKDIEKKKTALQSLIKEWIKLKDAE
jgi:TfoX/Sxy family transcriptional regulator of competence genes